MKRTALIGLFLLIGCALSAQVDSKIDIPSFLSPSGNQPMVQEALQEALVRVSRAYLVRDTATGEVFQRDGRNNFNEVATFAVRVKGGIIAPAVAAEPWKSDAAFAEYRGIYQGVASSLTVKLPQKSLTIDSLSDMESRHKGNLLYYASIKEFDDGLTVETINGEIDGWLVLLEATKDSTNKVVAIRKTVNLNDDKVEIEKPKNVSNIIGGIYVRPVYSLGRIDFRLCGIVMDGKDKYTLLRPQMAGTDAKQIENGNAPAKPAAKPENRKGLVPVKK